MLISLVHRLQTVIAAHRFAASVVATNWRLTALSALPLCMYCQIFYVVFVSLVHQLLAVIAAHRFATIAVATIQRLTALPVLLYKLSLR